MSGSSDWIRIASVNDVPEGEAKGIEIMGLSLALYHVDGDWFCTDNVCTHAFALLTDGWLDGHVIECPLHNGQFDIRTGKGLGSPIETDLRNYLLHIQNDEVMIKLD